MYSSGVGQNEEILPSDDFRGITTLYRGRNGKVNATKIMHYVSNFAEIFGLATLIIFDTKLMKVKQFF